MASGAEVPFPRSSATWLLSGGLSPSPGGPSTGPLEWPPAMTAAPLRASDSPGRRRDRDRDGQRGRENVPGGSHSASQEAAHGHFLYYDSLYYEQVPKGRELGSQSSIKEFMDIF